VIKTILVFLKDLSEYLLPQKWSSPAVLHNQYCSFKVLSLLDSSVQWHSIWRAVNGVHLLIPRDSPVFPVPRPKYLPQHPVCVPRSLWQTAFHTHIKPHENIYTVRSENCCALRLWYVDLVAVSKLPSKCAAVSLYSVVKQRLNCNTGKVCNCLIQFLLYRRSWKIIYLYIHVYTYLHFTFYLYVFG
jgi:hypothetical protein